MRLLLLHPLPLDGSIFSDGIRALADASVAPTLYGAGDDITSWAEAALDAVGDGPVVVVGNSIGGSCAIEVARLAPTKVKALVLCGTKPAHRPEPETRDAALQLLAGDGLAAGVRAFHGRPDGEAFLHSWSGPVWVVSGEHDIAHHRSRRLADRLPIATFHLLDGVGHYLPLEAPGALTTLTSQAVSAAR